MSLFIQLDKSFNRRRHKSLDLDIKIKRLNKKKKEINRCNSKIEK